MSVLTITPMVHDNPIEITVKIPGFFRVFAIFDDPRTDSVQRPGPRVRLLIAPESKNQPLPHVTTTGDGHGHGHGKNDLKRRIQWI